MSPIEDAYLDWLTEQIHTPKRRTYGELFGRLHMYDFLWTIPNDDNRVRDGLDLRSEFLEEMNSGKIKLESRESDIISILELIVALSRRIAFTAEGDPHKWAWQLIKNLRLDRMSDPMSEQQVNMLNDILYSLVWRNYRQDGRGGFFPLSSPTEDQTKVELWYQMNAYINEILVI